MGNCCGLRGDYLDIKRDSKEENKDLTKICNFDWNRGNNASITVQEMVLKRLTNDQGECVTPHVAHIAFSEFNKFMFLNKMFIVCEKKKEDAQKEEGTGEKENKTSRVGLFAPPLIDNVWQFLISLNVSAGKHCPILSRVWKIFY